LSSYKPLNSAEHNLQQQHNNKDVMGYLQSQFCYVMQLKHRSQMAKKNSANRSSHGKWQLN